MRHPGAEDVQSGGNSGTESLLFHTRGKHGHERYTQYSTAIHHPSQRLKKPTFVAKNTFSPKKRCTENSLYSPENRVISHYSLSRFRLG